MPRRVRRASGSRGRPASAFPIAGTAVARGERRLVEIPVARLPTQTMLALPVTVVNGRRPGPRLWLSAALHGDELNGIEIIRQVLNRTKPSELRGTLIAASIVNVFGFIHQSRYLPDRRDLNRCFPGSPHGSLASRLARLFMDEVVSRCTHGIDLHTGSHHRMNLPQIRANLDDAEGRRCARAFGAPLTIHAPAPAGSLRRAAERRGIHALLYEAGEPLRFDAQGIRVGVEGILRIMARLGMRKRERRRPRIRTIEARATKWVRAPQSGIAHIRAKLGERVRKKQLLCIISDALMDTNIPVLAPAGGWVIGHTNNPLVNRGDALLHLALPRKGK